MGYLVRYWVEQLEIELAPEVLSYVDRVDTGAAMLWYMSALNRRLSDLAASGRVGSVVTHLRELEQVVTNGMWDNNGPRVIHSGTNASVSCSLISLDHLTRLQQSLFTTYATEQSCIGAGEIKRPRQEDVQTTCEMIASVLQVVAELCPTYYLEYETYVNALLVYQSDTLASGTAFSLGGAIYIHTYSDITPHNQFVVLDRIIHETAHLHLHYQSMDELFVLNPGDELYPSPFRDQLRPMIAIYHAHFVLFRLLQVLGLPALCQRFDGVQVYSARKDYLQAYEKTTSVLMEFANFTEKGRDIFIQTLEQNEAACR